MSNKDKTINERFDAWYEEGKRLAKLIIESPTNIEDGMKNSDILDTICSGIDIFGEES